MNTEMAFQNVVRELERMPALGGRVRLTAEALLVKLRGGVVEVDALKVRIADISESAVTLEFAFCDTHDQTIVNVGRLTMRAEDVLTLAHITNCLHFHVD